MVQRNRKGILCIFTALKLNEAHKIKAYASSTLSDASVTSAKYDFQSIFHNQDGHVVIEMLSIYAETLIDIRAKESGPIYSYHYQSDEDYKEALFKWRWEEFDRFSERLNTIFKEFGLNVFLTRQGFISRQEEKITENIYVPVLKCLSSAEWMEVNRELKDSLQEYQRNTDQSYSNSITHSISATQAFLQILVDGKIGGSEGISALIKRAQEKKFNTRRQVYKNNL